MRQPSSLVPVLLLLLSLATPVVVAFQPRIPNQQHQYSRSHVRLFVAKSQEAATTSNKIPPVLSVSDASKFKRLKDSMWVRETEEDLTAAEFAISIENTSSGEKRKQKRAIDYDNLLQQLDRRIRDLSCGDDVQCHVGDGELPKLEPGKGCGAIAYTESQRNALFKRIVTRRATLAETIQSHSMTEEEETKSGFSIPIPEITLPKEEDDPSAVGPKLYVRDDGTVDWDGALQDRSALQNFGAAVWARINGQNPEILLEGDEVAVEEGHSAPKPVTVKIEETEEIKRERDALNALTLELSDMEVEHTALLNSALKAGQAVANINMATLEPSLRNKIRLSAEKLEKKSEEVSYQTLIYELERIYTYLSAEISNQKGYIPLQDRLNVAEFGLLESQVEGFNRLLESGENVDTDVLAVVLEQVTDFKRRLGIDYYVTGVTFDREAIARWLGDLLRNLKAGVAFYVKGCELFWNDIVFSLTLIGRALQGYTLKPREVRNLRRTFKDIVTFIPVIIILIIPLSPVGHVMVFGAIQRFFPDFFPSCFTERRQNLLSLYESTEYTEMTIDETWQEKLARLSSATGFFVTSSFLNLMSKLKPANEGPQDGDETVNGKANGENDVNGVNGKVNGKR